MNNTAWMAFACLAVAIGLSACKSNATPSTSSGNASVAAPVTATWQPAGKTAEFLSAFRPQD
ncbi:hypothetical protein H6CHR_04850 [Variovorax sp. PBL-H6]|uniref:hypothetical protein n=1 Tax=Variovorax sp. PBL-H6 TaxID=434009 RepID=UPI001315B1EB|nr:hypothetical protein [Variovorax sp. PBL-H6]VTU37006.1 hypothetical protein H6CHR_04850 [Variovorax sp. PBL-H6]